MAKRLKTYRIDGDLDDAVTAKAARAGETVTDVITRALREYVAGTTRRRSPAEPPPVKAASPGSPPRPRKTPVVAAGCPHRLPPGAWCKTCGRTKT